MAAADASPDQQAFEKADQRSWQTTFQDPCVGDWHEKWFLDGEVGTVSNTPDGMELRSGPEYKNDAHHMVLWTRESYAGDLKIEYEFTRLDQDGQGVCIIYIQATGSGQEGFGEDISTWNDYRKVPGMGKYFKNMNTYHISYACGYVRGRRYNPEVGRMNGHSELTPDFEGIDDLFEPGVPYRITVIKTERELFMKVSNTSKTRYFHMTNDRWRTVTHGRIGLRQMYTRQSRYKDIRISIPRP